MTVFTKVNLDITEYKPKMKPIYVTSLKDLHQIPVAFGQTTLQVKADGEFNWIHVDKYCCYAVNRFGRKTEDLPALRELHLKFLKHPFHTAEMLGEMYAMKDGKPLSLPKFVHYLKGEDKTLQNDIHIGLFELVNVDGFKGNAVESPKRFDMMDRAFNGKLCHVLEWVNPENWKQIEQYWTEKVEKQGWEGLVARTNGDTYKAKPNQDIDAVIIGVNKNNKGYAKGMAKSVKVALMREDGNFVEIGDATVPTDYEARELFNLTRVAVGEAGSTLLVKPLVIVQISCISLFPDTYNVVHDKKTLREIGTMKLVRMKSPRIVGYRKDKKVRVEDIGLNQVGGE